MHIAFITGNYPTPSRPSAGTFVQQFVWAMARQGHECSVINPAIIFDRKYGLYPPKFSIQDAGGGKSVCVYRPRYISFSSKSLGLIHTGRWTQWSFNRVAVSAVNTLPSTPDVVYGHFLYHAGYAAVKVGQWCGRPSVIGVGESSPWTLNAFGVAAGKRHFARYGFFLANSTPNQEMLENLLEISPERILVIPNGVDLGRMSPLDQKAMRSKHGLGPHEFIVVCVGANEIRKGPQRVIDAVGEIPGVTCILVGRGTESIVSTRVVKSGAVPHNKIPELLSCADLFVLPTMSEGSCNAVIEAMACGLPIVTSHGQYMDDIVDDDVAIRVDPTDVDAIRGAILTLKNDPDRRRRMAEACLRKAQDFDINERARRVATWMNELLKTQHNQRV